MASKRRRYVYFSQFRF